MNVSDLCKSYFNGFHEIVHFRTNTSTINALAILKIFSYFTVVIPLGFAALYGVSSLCGRVTKKEVLTKLDQKTDAKAKSVLNIPKAPSLQEQRAEKIEAAKNIANATTKITERVKQINAIAEVVKDFNIPTQELTLKFFAFRFGFQFFVGVVNGCEIPIFRPEGKMLEWLSKNSGEMNGNPKYCYPIKDAENNYFIPQEIKLETKMQSSGSTPAGEYLSTLFSKPGNLMEKGLLIPYAQEIHRTYPLLYKEIKERYPQYPDL